MAEEENWFEKTWGSILGRHSIKLDTGQMPKGVKPITWKDGSTTYNFQGKEYSNIKDVPVPRAEWIDKTASVLGESISKIPNIDKIGSAVAPIARTAEQLEHPFESQWAEMVGDSFQQYGIDRRIGVGIGYATFPGFGEVKAAKKAIKGSMELAPALARVDSGGVLSKADDLDLEKLSAQPLQVASNLQASKYGSLRTLVRDGSPESLQKARKILESGPGGKLTKKNTLVSIDKLIGTDEGKVILNRMMDRSESIEKRFGKYYTKLARKAKSTDLAQRELYDVAAKNLYDASELIYGQKGARKYLSEVTRWFRGDEWHHIFGNKEAGEFLLSQVAQDPVVAVNLFKKMDKLGLSSSGIADNIAIMKQKPHKALHRWYIKNGFQGGAGDFGELGRELGEAIVAGKADVNDLFRMLELHSDFNKHVRKLIKEGKFGEYGKDVRFLAEEKPGVADALQRGLYRARGPSKQDSWYK